MVPPRAIVSEMEMGEVRAWAGDQAFRARNWLRHRGVEVAKAHGHQSHTAHLDQLFADLRIDLVLDVGARQGEFGRFLRRNGYQGRIVSFEPVCSNYELLTKRTAGDTLWSCRNEAVGSADGTAEINVTDLSSFSSFRSPSDFAVETWGEMIDVVHVERVPVRRLDAVWDQVVGAARSVFLKIDTQGWDLEVLAGATGKLTEVRALQTEVSIKAVYEDTPSLADSLEALRSYGFAPSGLFPVESESDGRLIEMDCVAIPIPRVP